MWVKLKTVKAFPVHGRMTTFYPGDWVDVGRQMAQLWLSQGDAEIPDPDVVNSLIDATSGVLVLGEMPDAKREQLRQAYTHLLISETLDGPALPYSETLIWNPVAPLRLELISVGFRLLEKWQVVVPLWDYDELAAHVGSESDREAAQAVVRDLRVPLRNPNLLFVRRCEDTQRLIARWRELVADGRDNRLALLQAIYEAKPVVCDVPTTWAQARSK
jgi:hypothetical protein